MNLRIDPVVSIVRFYDHKQDRNKPLEFMKDKYNKSITLLFSDNGEVRLSNILVSPSNQERKDLFVILKEMGYSYATWRHKEKEVRVKL